LIKNIHTLIGDIHDFIDNNPEWFRETVSEGVARHLRSQGATGRVQQGDEDSPTVGLRLSQMGEKCPCQLWHSVHKPSLQEPLPASASIKYAYGHVIEAMVVELAKQAGHEVTGEQDVLYVDGVKGHRDCVIDGCVVDVKSASSMAYQKFKTGSIRMDDSFGYLAQLDGYVVASLDDPLVRVKDRGFLLAVDKTLGHMCIYEHRVRRKDDGSFLITETIKRYKDIIGRSTAPDCTCETVDDGTSGNVALGLKASYNPFKYCCAEQRGEKIRTFLYSGGPRYLTRVQRLPRRKDGSLVPEVDRQGKLVYN
jgi:hypothetical protein